MENTEHRKAYLRNYMREYQRKRRAGLLNPGELNQEAIAEIWPMLEKVAQGVAANQKAIDTIMAKFENTDKLLKQTNKVG